jgi:nucleoside-diphosphate-sugar epimerase
MTRECAGVRLLPLIVARGVSRATHIAGIAPGVVDDAHDPSGVLTGVVSTRTLDDDATDFEAEPVAIIHLPRRVPFGPTGGKPMTEDLPLDATTVKGRTRAAMTQELLAAEAAGRVRIAIGRASDLFGAGVTTGSTLGERVFAMALAGRPADFLGDPELLHTYSYVPDVAVDLATLGTDPRAVGEVWHLPGPETVTTRALLDLVANEVGHPVDIRVMPKLLLRGLGLVSPLMRGLAEMDYEFEEPFVLDTTKYESTFEAVRTLLSVAISETFAWYRNQRNTQ